MKAMITARPSVYGITRDGINGLGALGDDANVGIIDPTDQALLDSSFGEWWSQQFPGSSLDTGTYSGTPTNTTNGTMAAGINTASLIGSITNSFTSIFKAIQPVPAGCAQITNQYGTSTQCASNGTMLSSTLPTLGGISGTTLLLLGGAALVVFMVAKK